MVSNYKRKTERGSYTKEKLKEAAKAVKNGTLSGYKASQLYNIPRMTIMDCVNKKRTKSNTLGRNTALDPEAEAKLANGLKLMEKYGFGLSRKELLLTVGEYVEKNNISTSFKNGIPGQAWFSGYKKRHNLSIKKPQAVEYARKKAIDPFIVYPYFDLLKNTLEELNLLEKPKAIWNMDETSFSKDPEQTKIVGATGHAATRVISTPGRDNTTVLLCANAQGQKAPPMIIYKGKNVWDSWVSPDAYPNTSYAATANGWMESDVFEQYFIKTFLPTIGDQRPVLLIYDGHATHVGLNITLKALEAGVTILKLPAHTSHILQPLDVSLMKSFKVRWDELLVKWQRLNVGVALPKAEFARLIGEVWKQIDGQILRNGFRKAGIFPPNVDEIAANNFDSLKLQRWRQHSNKITTENSDKILAKNTPQSLSSLALDCIRKASTVSVKCNCSYRSVNTGQIQENLRILLNEDSAKTPERAGPKIQILENKKVSFEDLLLMKVKAGNKEIMKRRKMVPGAEVITHEDVIKRKIEEQTKNIKKEPMTKKGKGVGKKRGDSEKENRDKNNNEPGIEAITHEDELKLKVEQKTKNVKKEPQTKKGKVMGIKNHGKNNENRAKKMNKLKEKKLTKVISPDSTSVSDCVSLHSDSDAINCDKNIFYGEKKTSAMKMLNVDASYYAPSTSKRDCFATPMREKGAEKRKRQKKPKVRKHAKNISSDSTSVSDCVSIYSDSDDCDEDIFTNMVTPITMKKTENNKNTNKIRNHSKREKIASPEDFSTPGNGNETENTKDENNLVKDTENNKVSNKICDGSDSEKEVALDHNNTPDKGNETEKTECENNLSINDHVLVRYYIRKKWTYYVGYVEEIRAAEEVRYTIRFYKTVKSPLKFVLPKKRDCDDVPINSVVKKVHLKKVPNNSKEFVLSDNIDMVYFF